MSGELARALLHWWRMLVEPKGMGRLRGFGPKRWRVIYPEGPSAPMAYDEACNYRDIANMGPNKTSYIERVPIPKRGSHD